MSSAENRTADSRFCTVSISASLSLAAARSTVIQSSNGDPQTAGMRFEYSWAPTISSDSVRKVSPSFGSHENAEQSVLAATLTLSAAASPSQRPILPYERRCRSTCSITLQDVPLLPPQPQPQPPTPPSASAQNSPLHRYHPRRNSVGGFWEGHQMTTAGARTIDNVSFGGPRLTSTDGMPMTPQGRASSVDEVTGRKKKEKIKKEKTKGIKKQRTRPRSVHIDVYCTASDSDDDDDDDEDDESDCFSGEDVDSDESNTSTCYTVVRKPHVAKIRHVRKKKSLPHSIATVTSPTPLVALAKKEQKPVLSYRISAKELADALERDRLRDRRGDGEEQVDDGDCDGDGDERLREELFRDLTTDYSGRSPGFWSDASEGGGSASISSLADGEEYPQDEGKTWRSPGDERERRQRMLEQRKMQWRAAKQAEARSNQLLGVPVVLRRAGSADGQVSRRNSQRCPPADEQREHLSVQVQVPDPDPDADVCVLRPAVFQPPPPPRPRPPSFKEYRNASSIPRLMSKKRGSPVDIPQQFLRLDSVATTMATAAFKKFGHHVGPSRNPHCSCAHCVDHFSSIRSRLQQPSGF